MFILNGWSTTSTFRVNGNKFKCIVVYLALLAYSIVEPVMHRWIRPPQPLKRYARLVISALASFYIDFNYFQVLKRFPGALASRCFAFEPAEDQPDLDKAGGNVIMIPNESDPERLSMYLTTLVQVIFTSSQCVFQSVCTALNRR